MTEAIRKLIQDRITPKSSASLEFAQPPSQPPKAPIAIGGGFDEGDPDDANGTHGDVLMEWFPELEIGKGATVQLVWVTPVIASEWLKRLNGKQRRIKKNHLDLLVRDMETGRWRFSGVPIIFDNNESLIDGQHRLTAIVKSGKTCLFLVVRNVDPDAFSVIDVTAKRSGSDALRAMNMENTDALAAAAQMLLRYRDGLIRKGYRVYSPTQIQEAIAEHPGLAVWCCEALRAKKVIHRVGVPVLAYYLFMIVDPEGKDLVPFWDALCVGAELSRDSPILAFRNAASNTKLNADESLVMLIKCWNAYRKKKPVKLLRLGPDEECPQPV